jgi:hypothetical protein
LNLPGGDEHALRRAVSSLTRFLDDGGYGPALLFVARERGSCEHAHGLLAGSIPAGMLIRAWRSATKGQAKLARSVDSRAADPASNGVRGWLEYSARSLWTAELGSHSLATGDWSPVWSESLGTLPNPAKCEWCAALLKGQQRRFCSRNCKGLAARVKRRAERHPGPPLTESVGAADRGATLVTREHRRAAFAEAIEQAVTMRGAATTVADVQAILWVAYGRRATLSERAVATCFTLLAAALVRRAPR